MKKVFEMKEVAVNDVCKAIEAFAPTALQEDYDNAGLIAGNPKMIVKAVLICLDITEEIVNEAIEKKCNLIVAHHPPVFRALKRFTGGSETERILIKALKHDIALYAAHTNLDNTFKGVNHILALKLGAKPLRILRPLNGRLKKLVTFCPLAYADKLRDSLFEAGAGQIGNYDACSFNTEGVGTFRAGENTRPFVGDIGKMHHEKECRIETVFPDFLEARIISSLIKAHPYEEVAYDIYPIENSWDMAGSGMIAAFEEEMHEDAFLQHVKKTLDLPVLRHSPLTGKMIKKVALCGGSGSFLIRDAMRSGVDAFLTGDLKYHDFFLPEGKFLMGDFGHYESEQFAKQLLYELLNEKFSSFALLISTVKTNAVNYC